MLTRVKQWFTKRKLRSMPFYERTQYSFDGAVVRANDPLGDDIRIRIDDIREVGVETTCLGPFVEDVFWLINRDSEALRIPQCSPVFAEVMKKFDSLPGFDWDSFGRSMGSTDDAYFHCWPPRSQAPNQSPEPTPTSRRGSS